MADIAARLAEIVGDQNVSAGSEIAEDYFTDEGLISVPTAPDAVVRPATTDEVSQVLALCDQERVPVTARGSGTGLSGGAVPLPGGIVISFERMAAITEIDEDDHLAVVQPGVTLEQLDEALKPKGLVYPVFPGENSASLGGNVNTNAGGMRAVKYGVTRHHVLGLEVVLPGGEVLRTGGRFVKATSGYDLTQLIIGSEGTLGVVTEVILKLEPRLPHVATVLAPFPTLEGVTHAVPKIVASGVGPMILEYIDMLTMSAVVGNVGIDLGIPEDIKSTALAYLVVVVEQRTDERLEEDVVSVAELLGELGAMDVYVLPPAAGGALIEAREKAFWVAKANNANEIIDLVVPRSAIPAYFERVSALAEASQSWVVGCGHAGDGNVHLGVFQGDPEKLQLLLKDLFAAGIELGGAISGEHGIGTAKQHLFLDLEDPAKIALMRRIKAAFDPNGILNPDKIFGLETTSS
jgi:glycolate oxidase